MFYVSRAPYLQILLSGCASLLLVAAAHAQDVLEPADEDLRTQRDYLERQLSDMESTLGRHDPALIETISSLAHTSALLNLYGEASTLLDRSLQIQRLNLGLFAEEQIPLILAKAEIDARAGDWETVNRSLENLGWLLIGKKVSEAEALVDNLTRLAEFHLLGVVEDTTNRQAFHYQQASKHTYQALTISKDIFGPHDARVIDLNYSLVKQFYLQSVAVERGDDTAYALRAVVPGSKWVTPRGIAQSRYYRAGLRLLGDMRESVAQGTANSAESLAMVDLYIADWHLLFDHKRAAVAYKNAFQRLEAVEVDRTAIDRLFATPKILPIPAFHSTVSSALTNNYSMRRQQRGEPNNGSEDHLDFQDWHDAMSVVSFPMTTSQPGLRRQEDRTGILLRLHLDALNDVSRWLGGRYRTNIGVAETFDLAPPNELPTIGMETFDDRLHLMHFRPRLEGGDARPWEGTLIYPAATN